MAYLNSFSSSMTCMPCSYCCFVGASPTEAKWPFIVMTEGAVEAADGRPEEPLVLGVGEDMVAVDGVGATETLGFWGDLEPQIIGTS
jgi:hypothetical protein